MDSLLLCFERQKTGCKVLQTYEILSHLWLAGGNSLQKSRKRLDLAFPLPKWDWKMKDFEKLKTHFKYIYILRFQSGIHRCFIYNYPSPPPLSNYSLGKKISDAQKLELKKKKKKNSYNLNGLKCFDFFLLRDCENKLLKLFAFIINFLEYFISPKEKRESKVFLILTVDFTFKTLLNPYCIFHMLKFIEFQVLWLRLLISKPVTSASDFLTLVMGADRKFMYT